MERYYVVNTATFLLSARNRACVHSMNLSHQNVLAVAASSNSIKLYRADTFKSIATLSDHRGFVVGMGFDPKQQTSLWSCSRDGKVYVWDLEQQLFDIAFTIADFTPISFAVSPTGEYFVVGCQLGEEDAPIFVFQRGMREPLAVLDSAHSDDICDIAFSEQQPTIFITAGMDGLCNIIDIRALLDGGCAEEPEDAIVLTLAPPNGSSVHKVGFFGQHGEFVYGLTHDETLTLWHSQPMADDEDELLASFPNARANVQEQGFDANYLIDMVFQQLSGRLYLAVGNDNGDACLAHVNMDEITPVLLLERGHHDRVRTLLWDEQNDVLITGADDSSITSWSSTPAIPSSPSSSATSSHKTSASEREGDSKKPLLEKPHLGY